MKSLVIIPARLGSTRLPNKPLLRFGGKSMIRHTIDRVLASGLAPILVATDSKAIFAECSHLEGVHPVMTLPTHSCGTERVLEAYQIMRPQLGAFDLIINVQGDEPFISSEMLSRLPGELEARKDRASFWTTVAALPEQDRADQNVAKVVLDRQQNALLFTRDAISDPCYKHTSVYIYTPEFLATFCQLEPSPLELAYRLEQMRALDHGFKLNCIPMPFDAVSINDQADLAKAGITDFQLYQT